MEWFLVRGELAVNMLRASSYADLREKAKEEGTVCHGEYNQHNVLILKSKTAVTGFSHWCFGIQIGDLYHFMRKYWKIRLEYKFSRRNAKTYHRIRPISAEEWENLKIRFTYPENSGNCPTTIIPTTKHGFLKKYGKASGADQTARKWEAFGEQCFKEYNF